jgi:choline-sulfatase
MNSAEKMPNILVIMSDQHRADAMGNAGNAIVRTPNLDRLATDGVRFSNAYCTSPLCAPSRMSFMTCRHPHELDMWDNECQLNSDIPTFAHAFLSEGYDTVLSGRMHFVGWDQRHGFAERLIGDVAESCYLADGYKLDNVLGYLVDTAGMSLTGLKKSGPGRTGYHAYDEAVTSATVDWLNERGEDQQNPFLLTVGYVSPHCPFVAPPEDFEGYRTQISPADLPRPDNELHPVHPRNEKLRRTFGTDPMPPIDAQWRSRVAYYGLCSFLDRQVGAVLSALKNAGLADDTIVVYCSDHGEMLGEHGMWWKSTFYDGACRVPLIVSWPGRIKCGQVRMENVSLMDIGTTLIDLAGIEPLPGASGSSFAELLHGRPVEWDDKVFAEYTPEPGPVCRMVRSGSWKYNYYHGMKPELFNLQDDAGELNNLSGQPQFGDVEQRLNALVLQEWNPDWVLTCRERLGKERRLIANWVKATNPPEQDSLWFSKPPENWVDNNVTE